MLNIIIDNVNLKYFSQRYYSTILLPYSHVLQYRQRGIVLHHGTPLPPSPASMLYLLAHATPAEIELYFNRVACGSFSRIVELPVHSGPANFSFFWDLFASLYSRSPFLPRYLLSCFCHAQFTARRRTRLFVESANYVL